jgi:hypothetical protein
MAEPEANGAPAAAAGGHMAAPPNYRSKLSPFWPSNPASWFAAAEGQFYLDNVTDERRKYYMVLNALPETTVDLIADLVEGALPEDPYEQLKARLLLAHQLTDYQKVEKLSQIPPLGAQKPSELLASMLKLFPRGQEGSAFFTFFFLHRLPMQLRVLLSEEDHTDRRALAEKADRLWAYNAHHTPDVVAVISRDSDSDEATVAAVQGRSNRQGRVEKKKKPFNAKQRGYNGLSPADKKAVEDSGLCYYHWAYADEAKLCRKPCAWTGN